MFYFDSSQNTCEPTYVTADVFCHCKVKVFGVKATVVERRSKVQPPDAYINTVEIKRG